uniref:Uncharacterized protein n=1 Tax=Panagrolaimus sp. ES5 TaxID=591445 RepID=A0AC34FF95_9BILA
MATTTAATTSSTPQLLQEVPRRYVEQIQTTVETMRRRGISLYDGVFRLANRSSNLIEKTREQVEPMAYDVKDFVVEAVNNTKPLDEKNRELRNNLLEMYLGISVLCIGLSSGIICGATFMGYILSSFMNPFIELVSLFGIPIYAYMYLRKNAGIDETERRVWLYGLSSFVGCITGHAFGARLMSTVPAILFISPLVFALLIDYELGPRDLFADRQRLMIVSGGISSVAAYILAYCVSGFAFGPIISIVAMIGLLWVHFQVTLAADKKSSIVSTDLQFGYIVAALIVQLLVAILFGNSHFGETAAV